jgi:Protein of unknown function (DUF1688)
MPATERVEAPPQPSPGSRSSSGLGKLRSAAAVRERCGQVRRWVADGRSPHFTLDESRLETVAAYVADVTRDAYPDLEIPPHSRWRHFSAGGIDRWGAVAAAIASDPIERARAAVDLATASVLLDAGAGDAWRYREASTDRSFARSEGLAIAGLDLFRAGAFSSDSSRPLRVDEVALATIDAATLARGFQVDAGNPLIGLEQRAALLRRLAHALADHPAMFGRAPARPGHLVDYWLGQAGNRRIPAAALLATVLDAFASIWPSGLVLHGFPVGDAGHHPAVRTGDASDRIVPFHKLSQWLTCSLIEPLEAAGLMVDGLDELTALAEYRNGGLLVDLGVIRPRAPIDPQRPCPFESEFVVEWRALTVSLIEELVGPVRAQLGLGARFTMPHLLQGGTWSAGRKIARALRPPDGPSPIPVAGDGTVF